MHVGVCLLSCVLMVATVLAPSAGAAAAAGDTAKAQESSSLEAGGLQVEGPKGIPLGELLKELEKSRGSKKGSGVTTTTVTTRRRRLVVTTTVTTRRRRRDGATRNVTKRRPSPRPRPIMIKGPLKIIKPRPRPTSSKGSLTRRRRVPYGSKEWAQKVTAKVASVSKQLKAEQRQKQKLEAFIKVEQKKRKQLDVKINEAAATMLSMSKDKQNLEALIKAEHKHREELDNKMATDAKKQQDEFTAVLGLVRSVALKQKAIQSEQAAIKAATVKLGAEFEEEKAMDALAADDMDIISQIAAMEAAA